MIVVTAGAVLNTLVGLVATCSAVYYGIRVWVHPNFRTMLDNDVRIVASLHRIQSGFNHAIVVVALAVIFPVMIAGVLVFAVMTVGKPLNDTEILPAIITMFALVFGGPFAMIPCYAWLSYRVIAQNPQQCWPWNTLLPLE